MSPSISPISSPRVCLGTVPTVGSGTDSTRKKEPTCSLKGCWIIGCLAILLFCPRFAGQENLASAAPAIEKQLRPILVLERNDLPEVLAANRNYGVLLRELYRQSFLMAGRESLGLSTRDAVLRELPPENLAEDNRFRLRMALPAKGSGKIRVERGSEMKPEVIETIEVSLENPNPFPWDQFIRHAESLSRTTYVEALKKAGFQDKPRRFKENAKVSEATEKLIDQMNFMAQYAALRDLHARMNADGESIWLLGGLVRAYANLGVLAETRWSPAHKVFKARALLYAQRMANLTASGLQGSWHRAYALALAGIHGEALKELETARKQLEGLKKRGGELIATAKQPVWVPLIEALCRFDTAQLAEAAKTENQRQLAQLLQFVTVEDHKTLSLTVKTARIVLESNPECYRVNDPISEFGGLSNQHSSTQECMATLTKALPKRLESMPDLPEAAANLLKEGGAETKVLQALVEADKSAKDPDPSWTILARMAQDTRFVQVYRRLYFMDRVWNVSVTDFLLESLPLIAVDHPYRPLIQGFVLNRQRERTDFSNLILKMPLNDPDLAQIGILQAFKEIDPRKGQELSNRSFLLLDNIARDSSLYLRYATDPKLRAGLARTALQVCPHEPFAMAALIETDWKSVQKQAAEWEKTCQHPLVLLSLGQHYLTDNKGEEAERCLRKCMEASPDKIVFTTLANSYKAQGKLDDWKKTLDSYLEKGESHGLDHAQIQVEIARYFMAQMEWKKAQPYADEAAKTYAGWALLCASECYEGMQDWDRSEELVRAAAERYDDGVVRWYYWCRRTGKGDVQSAEKLVRKHINSLDDHFSQQDLTFFATFYVLAKEPAKALEMIAALSKQAPSETVNLLRMTLLDELSKTEDRNAIMKTLAGKDTPYGNMVKLFSDCLAKDEKGKLDGEAVEKIMKTVPADAVVDANYFVGKFLQHRGHKEEGVKYLQRSASGKNARSFLVKLLAVAELRDQGIEPEKGVQK